MLSPRLLPVLLAADRYGSADESEPLDRIRMQKGVFLFAKRGPKDWRDIYCYLPFDWGPYSSALASDLSDLVAEGLLDYEQVPGRRFGRYRTTPAGERALAGIPLDPRIDTFVRAVRHFVTTRSFSELLRDVYAAFPVYATRSRFQG
jgi:uncharacterized protein YwgA